jgi:hypothetical protein
MNDERSSGGRGPSSIKPPTIKPPTAQADEWGATSFSNAPSPSVGAMPPMPQSAPPPLAAASPPRRQQTVWLWIVAGMLLLGLFIFVLGVVVYLSLR